MKRIVLSAILLLGLTPFLNAQEEGEDWSFPVTLSTGERPVITDFVTAILSQEDIGESLGEMAENWQLYLAGKALPQGRSFVVDQKNGYIRYETTDREEDGPTYESHIEFCYWNCSDTRHRLVAENTVCYQDGKPFMGQFSGLCFYMYDGNTRRMEPTSGYDLGLDFDYPEDTDVLVQQLPRTGKTIEYHFYTKTGKVSMRFTWNGSAFILE